MAILFQTKIEEEKWPYNFTTSSDFPASDQRGHVSGRLLVRDRYISSEDIPANGSYLGLAAPGDVGSWQREYKVISLTYEYVIPFSPLVTYKIWLH